MPLFEHGVKSTAGDAKRNRKAPEAAADVRELEYVKEGIGKIFA